MNTSIIVLCHQMHLLLITSDFDPNSMKMVHVWYANGKVYMNPIICSLHPIIFYTPLNFNKISNYSLYQKFFLNCPYEPHSLTHCVNPIPYHTPPIENPISPSYTPHMISNPPHPISSSTPLKIPSSCRHTPSHTPSDLQQAPPHTPSLLKQSHRTTHLCKPEPISQPISETEPSHPTPNPKRLTPSQTTIALAIANIHHQYVKFSQILQRAKVWFQFWFISRYYGAAFDPFASMQSRYYQVNFLILYDFHFFNFVLFTKALNSNSSQECDERMLSFTMLLVALKETVALH